jgi:hypothetical protein
MAKQKDNPLQRQQLLNTLLLWEGRLNNARLRLITGISMVRASEWLKEFKDKFPDLVSWDARARSLYATKLVYTSVGGNKLSANATSESLSHYLSLVGLPHSPIQETGLNTIWSAYPEISAPDPYLFSALSEGIRTHRTVIITYRSMREPMPHQRTLEPHSIVRAGRRWHVRAYCLESQGFRDYAIGRMVRAESLDRKAEHSDDQDDAWNTLVPVRLIAHPLLNSEQQDVIRHEFFNRTAARVETCRGALVSYFIQDIRAAISPENQAPPDYQLAVGNIDEIRPWLFPA